MTPLASFLQEYSRGCGSELCQDAYRVCLVRGTVPCDVLFIGEAPGESENTLGRPFVGPAGQLLDRIIMRSIGEENIHRSADGVPGLSWAFTNLVCCIPHDPESGGKLSEPPDKAVVKCSGRLREFVKLCDPRVIICVGALAENWLDTRLKVHIPLHRKIQRVHITHPAAILRMPTAAQGLAVQKCVVSLRNTVEEYLCLS